MRQGNSVSHRGGDAAARPLTGAPDPAVARWIARTLAADLLRARSLIVTVWGDALAPHGGAIWLAALIRLLEPFGINERLTRTSVFRLARDGWLEAQARGREARYRLTPGGRARFEAAYRRIYAPPVQDWDGEWQIVLDPPGAAAAASRQRLRDALRWAGFGVLAPGCFARPRVHGQEDLPDDADLARVIALCARECDVAPAPRDHLPSRAVPACRAPDGRGALATAAPALFDLPAIAAGYRHFLASFGRVIERFRMRGIGVSDPQQCFVVRTLLIHAFRRVLLRDPRLPPPLLPLDWPGAAAFALTRDFYRLTLERAEAHLAALYAVNGTTLPPAEPSFFDRFGGLREGGRHETEVTGARTGR